MNTHKTYLLICFIVVSTWLSAAVETIHYDVILFGDKIGTMTVTHEQRGDGEDVYTLETHSKTKLLWVEKENFSHYDVVYKNGKLLSSTHRELDNKKLKRWTNIIWDGKQYQVDSYKGKRTFSEVPNICAVSLYFRDCRAADRIFYEAEADYVPVTHPEANTCEFKSSDGTKNIYHYENGRIKNMEFHISIATVKMVRAD
jgi:hypothetical protein